MPPEKAESPRAYILTETGLNGLNSNPQTQKLSKGGLSAIFQKLEAANEDNINTASERWVLYNQSSGKFEVRTSAPVLEHGHCVSVPSFITKDLLMEIARIINFKANQEEELKALAATVGQVEQALLPLETRLEGFAEGTLGAALCKTKTSKEFHLLCNSTKDAKSANKESDYPNRSFYKCMVRYKGTVYNISTLDCDEYIDNSPLQDFAFYLRDLARNNEIPMYWLPNLALASEVDETVVSAALKMQKRKSFLRVIENKNGKLLSSTQEAQQNPDRIVNQIPEQQMPLKDLLEEVQLVPEFLEFICSILDINKADASLADFTELEGNLYLVKELDNKLKLINLHDVVVSDYDSNTYVVNAARNVKSEEIRAMKSMYRGRDTYPKAA